MLKGGTGRVAITAEHIRRSDQFYTVAKFHINVKKKIEIGNYQIILTRNCTTLENCSMRSTTQYRFRAADASYHRFCSDFSRYTQKYH